MSNIYWKVQDGDDKTYYCSTTKQWIPANPMNRDYRKMQGHLVLNNMTIADIPAYSLLQLNPL